MPTGILDFVLVEAILWAKGQGYRTVNLGLTPPRGLARRDTVSRWKRFGAQLYRHGEHYSDFNELPSQGQICSTLGPAVCQLSARSCFSSRDPGFGKTGGRKFHAGGCSKNLSFAASGSPLLHRRALALTVLRDKQNESPCCLTGQCVPPVDQDEKLPPEAAHPRLKSRIGAGAAPLGAVFPGGYSRPDGLWLAAPCP
jgi:Phosphatidylglycerol lysyltransferase, C-terminal